MRSATVAVAVALLAVLGGCAGEPEQRGAAPTTDVTIAVDVPPCPEQEESAAAGDAPPVVLECLNGGTLDLGRAPGVPTVVNMWASWCTPCREELPIVEEFAGLAGDRVRVLGVASEDGMPQATSFADDAGLSFPNAFDGEGELAAGLGLRGLPHTVLLAADGSVAHVEMGQIASIDELRGLVTEHLGVTL